MILHGGYPPVPKPGASANSATPAFWYATFATRPGRQLRYDSKSLCSCNSQCKNRRKVHESSAAERTRPTSNRTRRAHLFRCLVHSCRPIALFRSKIRRRSSGKRHPSPEALQRGNVFSGNGARGGNQDGSHLPLQGGIIVEHALYQGTMRGQALVLRGDNDGSARIVL